jgi:hypothetical protein
MSIKLLPASVIPPDPPQTTDVSTGLIPLAPGAVTTRAAQITLVPDADAFARSSSSSSASRRGQPNLIYGTLVEDSPSDPTENDSGRSGWQYVSTWAWNHLVGGAAITQYLSYAASPANWSGQLVDVYA